MYSFISPCEKNILLLILEEIDGIIEKIHTGSVEPHKHLTVQIRDKNACCSLDWCIQKE